MEAAYVLRRGQRAQVTAHTAKLTRASATEHKVLSQNENMKDSVCKNIVALDRCVQVVDNVCTTAMLEANLDVFRTLSSFIDANAANVRESPTARQVPTALLSAGAINAADHDHFFRLLVTHLRDSCSYQTVLVQVTKLLNSGSPKDAIAAIWNKVRSDRRCKTERILARQCMQKSAVNANVEKYQEQSNTSKATPVVIVLQDSENVQRELLRDVVLSLTELRNHLPLVLVLGFVTSTNLLQSVVPASTAARLTAQTVEAHVAVQKFQYVVEKVVCSVSHFPMLDTEVVANLNDCFMENDFCLLALRRNLLRIAVEHFASEPLSDKKSRSECTRHAAKRTDLHPHQSYPGTISDTAKKGETQNDKVIKEVKIAYAKWRVGILCLKEFAKLVGSRSELANTCRDLLDALQLTALLTTGIAHHDKILSIITKQQFSEAISAMSTAQIISLMKKWQDLLKAGGTAHDELFQRTAATIELLENTPESLCNTMEQEESGPELHQKNKDMHTVCNNEGLLTQEASRHQQTARDFALRPLYFAVLKLFKEILSGYVLHSAQIWQQHSPCLFSQADVLRYSLTPASQQRFERQLRCPSEVLRCNCCLHARDTSHCATTDDTCKLFSLLQKQGDSIEVFSLFRIFIQHTYTAEQYLPQCSMTAAQEISKGKRSMTGEKGREIKLFVRLQASFIRAFANLQHAGILRSVRWRRGKQYTQRTGANIWTLERVTRH
mmetsp:Transcript_935/g.3021  ORF Transcript_935/g.3021 Transcript_935/m.3021 type:complete len:724 (-) Transcript_935:1292-3463(-)